MAQDVYYLRHFAAAYAAAIDKCPLADLNARADLNHLLLGVHKEVQLHGGFASSWGKEPAGCHQPCTATKSYTDFLNQVADDPEVRLGKAGAGEA